MVSRVHENGMPFEAVDCDSLYGRKGWFRDQLNHLDIEYYADIPENTRIYLTIPSPLIRWQDETIEGESNQEKAWHRPPVQLK